MTHVRQDDKLADSMDPVAQTYPDVPMMGWVAKTGQETLSVLSALMAHLERRNDAPGMQLLSRVWRFNSPVLAQIVAMDKPDAQLAKIAQERRMKVQQTINDAGNLMGLDIGDDVTEKLIPFIRTHMEASTLLADFIDMCGYTQDDSHVTVRIHQDDATRTACVQVGSPQNQVAYSGGSVRGAIRLAVDGEKERSNG